MEIKRRIFFVAFLLTAFLLMSLLFLTSLLDDKREDFINAEMQKTYNQLGEMQLYLLMSETYGSDMACIVFDNKLRELDQHLWNLGRKIESYRAATEEFVKSEYYLEQKRTFNENEIFYLMLLTKLRKECDFDEVIISFFYKNSDECKKCDDQSFVLTDINKDIDDEVAIFSFDADLNITGIKLLSQFHDIQEYPCLVIDDQKHCGMLDKDFILEKVCEANENVSVC